MRPHLTFVIGLLCCSLPLMASEEPSDTLLADAPRKDNIFKQFFRAFNAMDTTYIIPNKYNWAFMLQNTNSFETYTLHSRELGQKLSFSPKPAVKIGPYSWATRSKYLPLARGSNPRKRNSN